jgi:hypothetical protein
MRQSLSCLASVRVRFVVLPLKSDVVLTVALSPSTLTPFLTTSRSQLDASSS